MKRIILITLFALPLSSMYAQSVDILWQGETYTPPFYEGRALWSKQSLISMTAIPQSLGNPGSLIYKWTQNGTVLGNISGVGKNTLKFEDSIFSKPYEIKVEILSADEEILAENTIVIESVSPQVLIYENNPVYGYSFHKEAGNAFRLPEGEITLAAFPLFGSPKFRESDNFSYEWRVNNGELLIGPEATYRAPEGGIGSSEVTLLFKDVGKVLPSFSRELLIQFGYE